jgi:hypothetical protein
VKHGKRTAIGAAAVVALLGVLSTSALASAGSRTARTSGRAAWAPVPYRDAQLSVPGSWLVESPQQLSCGLSRPGGMIFTGLRPQLPRDTGCGLAATVAWLLPAGRTGHRRPTAVINGIPVYRLASTKGTVLYLVPALGVRVGARGPLARRVLATLTRSPLAVVLARGRTRTVPASWTWRRLGGVRFAVPGSWSEQRDDQWATCGTGVEPDTNVLITATKPPLALPCPYEIPTAAAEQAVPGATVVTGKYAAVSVGVSYARCQLWPGLRICLSSVTGQGGPAGGVLIFSVARPGHRADTFFLLGLPGAGGQARTILDSLRPAR